MDVHDQIFNEAERRSTKRSKVIKEMITETNHQDTSEQVTLELDTSLENQNNGGCQISMSQPSPAK